MRGREGERVGGEREEWWRRESRKNERWKEGEGGGRVEEEDRRGREVKVHSKWGDQDRCGINGLG